MGRWQEATPYSRVGWKGISIWRRRRYVVARATYTSCCSPRYRTVGNTTRKNTPTFRDIMPCSLPHQIVIRGQHMLPPSTTPANDAYYTPLLHEDVRTSDFVLLYPHTDYISASYHWATSTVVTPQLAVPIHLVACTMFSSRIPYAILLRCFFESILASTISSAGLRRGVVTGRALE